MNRLMVLGALLLATCGVASADGFPVSDMVTLNGIFQGRYGAVQGPGSNWKSGGMDIRRAELGVLVNPIKNLSFKLQADFSTGTTVTKDLWAKYLLAPNLGVTFGQFVVPFGFENQVSDVDLVTLERATFDTMLFPNRRDRGAKAEFTQGGATLQLAALNGDGPNVKPLGNDKEGVVRLSLPVAAFAKVGVSGLYGNDKFGTRNAFGADAQADFLWFVVSGEYIRAHDAGRNPSGWLLQAVVPFTARDQFVGKYDTFDADLAQHDVAKMASVTSASNPNSVKTLNLGVTHSVNKNLSLKLFYVNTQASHLGNSNGVTAEVLAHF